MAIKDSFIHITFLDPQNLQIIEEVDGEHPFVTRTPFDLGEIARLEEKYIFPDGAADRAREQLKSRQYISIPVHLRER